MIKHLSLTVLLTGIMASPLCAASEQQEPAKTSRLSNHMKYAAAVSAASLGAGIILKNNALKGIGLGTATGTACAVLQNDIHWVLAWLGEIIMRGQAARAITTYNDQLEVDPALFGFVRGITPVEVSDDALRAQFKKGMAEAQVSSPAWVTSWISYLLYRHLENKEKATA